jgi:hypothetical protein
VPLAEPRDLPDGRLKDVAGTGMTVGSYLPIRSVVTDRGDKAERRAARERVGSYHETELARLLERVREGFARFDAGELDAFELDDLIHRYKRSTRELWKFCSVSGGHAVTVARMLEDMGARDELPDWWDAGRTPSEREGAE